MKDLRIGILGNPEREGAAKALQDLLNLLSLRGVTERCYVGREMEPLLPPGMKVRVAESLYDLAERSNVLFSLGGDGTMLAAARAIMRSNPKASLIGVNLGKLGFLSENPPEELDRLLLDLEQNLLRAEERLMLEADVFSQSDTATGTIVKHDDLDSSREGLTAAVAKLTALNEVVIDNFGSTRMLTFEVFVDGALLGFMRADGMIISTPTGSTGYAVSAGGPLVEPTSPVLIIAPIAPHSLNVRPIIIPEHCEVKVRASSEETKKALVVSDGQEEIVVDTPAITVVKASEKRLRLLRRRERSYFDLLRKKFLWSLDSRDFPRGRRS